MPFNSLNVGRDVTVDVTTSAGPLTFSIVTGFSSKPKYKDLSSTGLDGVVRHAALPAGWDGTFEIERGSGVVDAYFAQLEAAYYNGQNQTAGTITETIQEVDGTVSQYRYEGAVLKLQDAGTKAGDKLVKMKVQFEASFRRKVA